MNHIYTVTSMYVGKDGIPDWDRNRCVAWYPDEMTARRHVLENWGDLWEVGYYNYAVVEKQPPGAYALDTEAVAWFQLIDVDTNLSVELDTVPPMFRGVINFGIG